MYHNKLTSEDWAQLKSRDIKFVYLKVSEGASYKDPMRFRQQSYSTWYVHIISLEIMCLLNLLIMSQNNMSLSLLPCIDYEKAGFKRDFKTRIRILKELNSLFYNEYGTYPIIYCDLIEYSRLRVLMPNKFWISASSPDLKVGKIKQSLGKVNGKILDFNKGSLKDILFSDQGYIAILACPDA